MSQSKILKVQGGRPLNGTIPISGAKNAILPLMAATLLTNRPVEFQNVPNISDVDHMIKLLQSYGVEVSRLSESSLRVVARNVRPSPEGPNAEIGRTFRASLLLLGPLLVRCGEAFVYHSGGDAISTQGRGNDFHISRLRHLGALVRVTENGIIAEIPQINGLRGRDIVFPKVSVGATQNIMMAACAVYNGTTTIEGASIEPETKDLVKLLQKMGAIINVDKTSKKYTIQGKPIEHYSSESPRDQTISHTVILDRIEAGTYAIAAAITRGSIEMIMNISDEEILNLLDAEFWRLLASGVEISRTRRGIIVKSRGAAIGAVSVKTRPFPGFPTDMHPQWAALMSFSNGECWIEENIFDDRFNYVQELQKMGAAIMHEPRSKRVIIDGNRMANWQSSYDVEAGDIRAGAALILAALAKNAPTVIRGVKHIERGYENFVGKFRACGARMEMIED